MDCAFHYGAGMEGLTYFHLYYYPDTADAGKGFTGEEQGGFFEMFVQTG